MRRILIDVVDLLGSVLPEALLGGSDRVVLVEAAKVLAPIPRIGLECRLDANAQVDLQQNIKATPKEQALLQAHISSLMERALPAHRPPLERLQQFCTAWSDASLPFLKAIPQLWLEFDRPTPEHPLVPSVFLSFALNLSMTETLAVTRDALGILRGVALDEASHKTLTMCFEACPEGVRVSEFGAMVAREPAVFRVNVQGLPADAIPAYYERVGAKVPEDVPALVQRLFDFADTMSVCLDVGERVYPGVGLECFLRKEPDTDPRWQVLLDDLIEQGLCTSAKRDALLAWPGYFTPRTLEQWPESLIVASLLASATEVGVLRKKVSHIKVTCRPGSVPAVKAYLGFGHKWIEPQSSTDQEDLSVGETNGRPQLSLDKAVERGIEYIVQQRGQSGWWRDYYGLVGASDEWLTAYVGTALAVFPNEQAQHAAHQAWKMMQSRRAAEDGWGFCAVLPCDADSTAWGLRLAEALDVPVSEQIEAARQFLSDHQLANGGVTSYLLRNCPLLIGSPWLDRALAQSDREVAFAGYRTDHTCVTAGAAEPFGTRFHPYLRATQRTDGGWTGYWWCDDGYTTALAARALATDPNPQNRAAVQAAVEWALGQIEGDGFARSGHDGTPSAFATAWVVQLLTLAEASDFVAASLRQSVHWLLAQQRDDGSWEPSAWMRVPPPEAIGPDTFPEPPRLFLDRKGLLTTTTVLTALDMARSLRSWDE